MVEAGRHEPANVDPDVWNIISPENPNYASDSIGTAEMISQPYTYKFPKACPDYRLREGGSKAK
jgi:hypothetical protein